MELGEDDGLESLMTSSISFTVMISLLKGVDRGDGGGNHAGWSGELFGMVIMMIQLSPG